MMILVGSAHAGDEPWDQEFEYGDGQVGPGTGGDWRPMQTCWRFDNPRHPEPEDAPVQGLDYDWPFCHDIEDDDGDTQCLLDDDAGVSGAEHGLFAIFLGDYQEILRKTGANLITLKDPSAGDFSRRDPYVVYARAFGKPDAPPSSNRFVSEVAGDPGLPNSSDRRAIVGSTATELHGVKNTKNGPPITHTRFYQSRERYIRDLYYSRTNIDGGTQNAWWMNTSNLRQVPARESPRFFIRWQHPDHPMGGLMTDYAYVLQQQNYLNAQLLGNVRSYNADGHRVIYKVQSKEAVLLHGQQVGNCGVPTGTVHPHPTTCTLTGTITSHRVVYPSTIALSYDYNPAPPRFGPTPTPFITRLPPTRDDPITPPARGTFEDGLEGTRSAPYLTPQFQHRQAFDAGLPKPVGPNVPTAPPGFAGEQVHVPEYTYYDVSRVGTYDYPYYGVWGMPWEDFGVDYHRVLKDARFDAASRWEVENLDGVSSVRQVRSAWPSTPSPTDVWYLTTRTPTPQYVHDAKIGVPDRDLEYPSAVDEADRLHSNELGYRFYEGHNGRGPYPTPDQLIFSDGPARQVKNPFIIRDYPNTSLDAISIEMEMPAIYREDVFVNYVETDELLEDPVQASRFDDEYAGPLFSPDYVTSSEPALKRTDAISGYQQFFIPVGHAPVCNPGTPTCPHQYFGNKSVRPSVYDVRGENLGSEYPDSWYLGDTYRYRWPVYFDDVSWYLFELHGVNKALADSDEFAKAVLDHNPFTGTTHYPAWALDPRMVSRPYDGMGHPVVRDAPASPATGGIPDIPHRYYGGGLANYRNTVDPLEHKQAVIAMGALSDGIPVSRLAQGNNDSLPAVSNLSDIDGYGLYTNRRVFWGEPKFGGFDGGNAFYELDDWADSPSVVYSASRNHNLTFLPLKPAIGYEPGGTLVKRGVTSPEPDGSNSRLEWMIHDSSPIQVHGGHGLSSYQVLGMPMPGSYLFGQLQYQWPDYPVDPNRTYLLATMYYEASFLSPFYIVKDPSSRYAASDPSVEGRGLEVVGRVPRMVMRPVFCRVLIQPLGVNTGPWASFKKGVSATYTFVDDAVGGAISRNVDKVKEKVTSTYEKAKEVWDKLNPIQFFVNAVTKGSKAVTEKGTGLICKAGQMADYTAGSTGGEADDTNDLDQGQGGGNRQARQESLQRCRELDAAQEVESEACPEGASDSGLCGVVPKMEIYADYSAMEAQRLGSAGDNKADFGIGRGYYERPHWLDNVRVKNDIDKDVAPAEITPGPLQFGYFPPGDTFALPQLKPADSSWTPVVGGGGSFPYEDTNLTLPRDDAPTTRCPTEWELAEMGAPGDSWHASGTSWQKAVKSQWDAHNPPPPSGPLHPDVAHWGNFPPYELNPPTLGEEDVRQAYADGLCAPMQVAIGCNAGPDGQCPGTGGLSPWSVAPPIPHVGSADRYVVGVPVHWRSVDPSSADAVPNYLDVEITAVSTDHGRVNFYTGSSSVNTQGAALFDSSDFVFRNSAPYPEVYRVPASWLWMKTGGELTTLNSQGMIFGSLEGLSVKYQYNDAGDDYDWLCDRDVKITSPDCSPDGDYFSANGLRKIPTTEDTVGLDPQGLANPLQDYPSLVHDLVPILITD